MVWNPCQKSLIYAGSFVPRPTSQLRMDYITATRVVDLVSSCTNFCPVAPECWSDQSDLRYALIAYSNYQSKLSVMAVRLEMDDVQVKRAIQSAGERMGHAKVKDEQFRIIEDVVRGRDTFVSLPTGYGKSLSYGVLPWVFDELSRNSTKRSIVIVVSPLIRLTAIQVTFVAKRTGNCFLNMGRYCIEKGAALFLQQCICTTQLAIIHDTRF